MVNSNTGTPAMCGVNSDVHLNPVCPHNQGLVRVVCVCVRGPVRPKMSS